MITVIKNVSLFLFGQISMDNTNVIGKIQINHDSNELTLITCIMHLTQMMLSITKLWFDYKIMVRLLNYCSFTKLWFVYKQRMALHQVIKVIKFFCLLINQ